MHDTGIFTIHNGVTISSGTKSWVDIFLNQDISIAYCFIDKNINEQPYYIELIKGYITKLGTSNVLVLKLDIEDSLLVIKQSLIKLMPFVEDSDPDNDKKFVAHCSEQVSQSLQTIFNWLAYIKQRKIRIAIYELQKLGLITAVDFNFQQGSICE